MPPWPAFTLLRGQDSQATLAWIHQWILDRDLHVYEASKMAPRLPHENQRRRTWLSYVQESPEIVCHDDRYQLEWLRELSNRQWTQKLHSQQ